MLVLAAVAASLWVAPSEDEPAEPPLRADVPQLAWFYKPPTDGTPAAKVAGRSDRIVLTKNDEPFLQQLREASWPHKVPQYVGLPWTRGPAGHERPGGPCTPHPSIGGNSFAWFADDFCERLHPHESVFLHREDGERLYLDPGDGFGWLYAVDPADEVWRRLAVERIDQTFAGDGEAGPFGYGGLFLDEAWASRGQLLEGWTNADGTLAEYDSDEAWQDAVRSFLDLARARVHAHGHRVWINTDHDSTSYDDAADGIMVENFAAGWEGAYLSADELVALWERIEGNAEAGRGVLLVGQGERAELERMRFAYAAYLMVAAPQVVFRYSSEPDGYRELWHFREYDVDLGTPAGPRTSVAGDDVWRRDFSGGTALVNLAARESQLVLLGGRYRTLDGQPVTELSLPPHGGAVLRSAGG